MTSVQNSFMLNSLWGNAIAYLSPFLDQWFCFAGAGGNWRVIDEIFDDPRVIAQDDLFSCTAACAEMLLRDRGIFSVSQTAMYKASEAFPNQVGRSILDVRDVMNQLAQNPYGRWQTGQLYIPEDAPDEVLYRRLSYISSKGSWMGLLQDSEAKILHAVVVDGLDAEDLLRIRDPFVRSSYKMEQREFSRVWIGHLIFFEAQ